MQTVILDSSSFHFSLLKLYMYTDSTHIEDVRHRIRPKPKVSNCQLPFSPLQQHPSSTCVWSLHLTTRPLF